MTDPAMTSRAVRGARLVGWPIETAPVAEGALCIWHPHDEGAIGPQGLLVNPAAAILHDALLDWCAERGMEPSIYRRGKVWRTHAQRCGNHWDEHPTKLGALLLALDAAGVLPEGE